MLAGQPRPRRRGDRGNREWDAAVGIGRQLQPGIEQLVRCGLRAHRLAGEQAHHDVEIGLEQFAGIGRCEADHRRVGGQRSRSHAADNAAVGEVVEQHQPVGDPQRIVVGERNDAGAESDFFRPFGGRGDEDLRRADDFAAGGVVFAEPHFVEPECVDMFDEFEVTLQRQRRVGACAMERRDEIPEP